MTWPCRRVSGDGDPLGWRTLSAELFGPRAWRRRGLARNLLRCARLNGNLVTPGSGSDATTAGPLTARQEAGGRVHVPRRSCSCASSSTNMTKLDTAAPDGLTRIGLQDGMTFIGSAAPLNRSWNELECTQAEDDHRLRGHKCGVLARGFEQLKDQELPLEMKNLCGEGQTKTPRRLLAWVCCQRTTRNTHRSGPAR